MTVAQLPTPVRFVDPESAADLLAASGPDARGFFDLDPVTDNAPLLARGLAARRVQTLVHGQTLLGFRLNPAQPRQAWVASAIADPGPLAELLTLLATYVRCTSFVATAIVGSAQQDALHACGFVQVGVLPRHSFRSGTFHDVAIHHRTIEVSS